MKKFLHSTSLLLLSWCLLIVGTQQAHATHIQGGQLTYLNVGPNQYVVTLYLYRDCSGDPLPGSMTLIIRNGCTGTTLGTSFPMAPVPNSISVGTQYCAAQQQNAQCTSNAALPNYQTQQYRSGTITITPGQWTLSTETCCRPNTANLVGSSTSFRYEATLNNLITLANGQTQVIQNNSAQYSATDVPVPFVPFNQQTTIGFNTNDPDNTRSNPDQDSLVYSLTNPLQGCNDPVTYKPYPTSGPIPHPTIAGCFILPPTNTPTTYTAQLPVDVSYSTTGTCPILTGVNNLFSFNAAAGQFTFTPRVFNGGTSREGRDKYVIVGRVDDYRKLPGSNRRYLVGSVRREIFVIVTNSTNIVPSAPTGTPVTPNAGTTVVQTTDSLDVTIQPCNYSQVLVRFTDPDVNDLLTVTYTGTGTIPVDVLQSGDIGTYTLNGNGTRTPVARFLFQPSPAYAGRVLRIPFQIQDDACPVRGLQTRILIVRIASTRRDLATRATPAGAPGLNPVIVNNETKETSICPGGSLQLLGAVLRPDSTRGRLQSYNYAWTGNGIVGNPNQATVTVNPTITTRYRLAVNPVSGFQTGVCADTASVLVRVVAEPQVAIVASNADVCPNGEITLTATASRPNDNLTDTYTYEWKDANGAVLPQTGNTVTVRPTGPTSYSVQAKGFSTYGCEANSSINLNVAPAAVASFDTVNVVAISSRAGSRSLIPPVTFKFTNTSRLNPINSAYQLDSVRWTYQRVRTASGEPVTSLPVRFSTSRTEATTPPLEPGYYLIKLTVNTRAAGTNCPEATAQYTVFVPNIEVPNIITPNGDNFNDFFVVNADQRGGKLEIFNRWGRKVQEYGNYQNTWNGEGQSDGVYYYYLTDRQGNKTKGWVEIVRGGK
jgi:gliding motility-associated-like protein